MKNVILISFLSAVLLLNGCGESQPNKINKNSPPENIQQANQTKDTEIDYEATMLEVIGNEFFEDRAFMRIEDEVVLEKTCAVFAVGTNRKEQFVTEERIAVASDGLVYWYDIVADMWFDWEKQDTAKEQVITPENIDYSQYSSLIESYEKAMISPTGESTGQLYTNLVDFNGDDILELVLIRIFHGINNEYIDWSSDAFVGDWENPVVQVYSIDNMNKLQHAGSFPLIFYPEEGGIYDIGYATIDGTTYLVTGGYSDPFLQGASEKTLWKYVNNGEASSLLPVCTIRYENIETQTTYYIDGVQVDESEYKAIADNIEYHAIISKELETTPSEKLEQTKQFLADYPAKNSISKNAIFNNGWFVIIEDNPSELEEDVVIEYLRAVALNDFDTIRQLVENEDWVKQIEVNRNEGHMLPGIIITDITTMDIDQAGQDSIRLANEIEENGDIDNLNHPKIVKCEAVSVHDKETVDFTSQFPTDRTMWIITDDKDSAQTIFIDSFYSNDMYTSTPDSYNPFYVSFVGYSSDINEIYGLEIPIFEGLIMQEEQEKLEYYSTENGDELYLIKSTWNSNIKVYENSEDGTRGELLYETDGNVLYLQCNESDIHSEVEIVTVPYGDSEYNYYPAVDLVNGKTIHGDYSADFPRP